jgi:uncharacterized protein (TIGR02646 family)
VEVRSILPKRRLNPTKNPKEGKWTEHKKDLQEDFNFHCAYCGSYDGFRHTWYEVDHFIPKSFFIPLKNISTIDYSNLVYSCKFCNNKKLSKWPSQSESIHHINNQGFVDPCDPDYENHLYRTTKGSIMWKTDLGEWMVKRAFKFDERDYSIRILWQINETRKLIDKFVEQLSQIDEDSEEYINIKSKANELCFEYYYLDKELMNYYNSL